MAACLCFWVGESGQATIRTQVKLHLVLATKSQQLRRSQKVGKQQDATVRGSGLCRQVVGFCATSHPLPRGVSVVDHHNTTMLFSTVLQYSMNPRDTTLRPVARHHYYTRVESLHVYFYTQINSYRGYLLSASDGLSCPVPIPKPSWVSRNPPDRPVVFSVLLLQFHNCPFVSKSLQN